jgi:hypothetical protein
MAEDPGVETIPDYLLDREDMIPEQIPDVPGAPSPPADALLPPVNTELPIPTSGLYGTHSAARRFAISQTIRVLTDLGKIWNERHSDSPIGIGDISKNGGGQISGHVSHRKGIDVDIRPLRNDQEEQPVTIHQAAYSRALTQELVDLIDANPVLAVQFVFFNDSQIQGARHQDNHDNHLHVRFHLPSNSPAAPPLLVRDTERAAVRELQRRLNMRAASLEFPLLTVDGRFGAKTEEAVKAFQTTMGLSPDGKVGRDTWSSLST